MHSLLPAGLLAGPLSLLVLGSAAPTAAPRADDGPGNILILVADDLGLDQLAVYGIASDPAPTPNLDGLAAGGVVFSDVWSQPTCSPTRATIQTGRYGFRTGIGVVINAMAGGPALPLSEVTLPEMLDLGTGGAYAHAAIGKWHLGSSQVGGDLAPNLAGYSHFAGSLEGQLGSYSNWRRVVDGVGAPMFRYATTVCVDDALVWIHAQDRPWLCVIDFQAPHAPFHRPPAALHTQVLPSQSPSSSCGAPGADPRPFYKAMVEALDTEIGRLLASLPNGQRERTTVFFLGDNGTDGCVAAPSFPSAAKGTLSESGLRVPLIASGYRVTARGRCASLVNTSDLFATVAELAGVDLAAALPGLTLDSQSFAPCLADVSRRVRRWIFADVFTPNGPGQPAPLPPCPAVDLCQTSLGFDGPGDSVLESCGPPLYGRSGANLVPWRLSGAPPNAHAWLLIGPEAPGFEPQLGAFLGSLVPSFLQHYRVGPAGTIEGVTWTGSTSRAPVYQVVLVDTAQPGGFGVTNALRMDPLWTNSRAVRRARFKLIRFDPCDERLYDLALDPFETRNLLRSPLNGATRAAYERLAQVLDTLH